MTSQPCGILRTKAMRAMAASLILTPILLASSDIGAAPVNDAPWAEKTPFQKRLPGPPRLRQMQADNSGTVNADPGFIADRMTIINHVMAYAYLADEQRFDAWLDLFSDDVEVSTTGPCTGTWIVHGRGILDKIFAGVGVANDENRTMMRHATSNLHVAYQTKTQAQVRTYMTVSVTPPFEPAQVSTTGTYSWQLEKRGGRWIGTRLYVEMDYQRASFLPAESTDTMEFIPDDSPECKGK